MGAGALRVGGEQSLVMAVVVTEAFQKMLPGGGQPIPVVDYLKCKDRCPVQVRRWTA
jgi:hypothetical protein